MTSEQIIERILSKHQEVSREQIEERLVREKRRTNGLISDSILLRMIAGEFGLDFQNDEAPVPTLSVADLISGLGNVTVVGRVVAVFTPRTFNRIRSGKFASFLIADKNSIIRVVLWNSKTNLVESGEIKVGQVVRVFHAYTKEGRAGVELHAGESCSVEVNPQDVDANDYPTISKFVTRIADLTHLHRNRKVNVSGVVKKLFSSSTFERRDLSRGKVMRFALADMTGEMSIVAWNDKVDELEPMLKEDTGLRLVNAKVKKATTGELEIHVDAETYVEALQQIEEFMRIADLKEGLTRVSVEGTVIAKPIVRDVATAKQELVKLATFELKDESGGIWVSAWRKHADSIKDLKIGDRLLVKDVYVKKGFGDRLEISTRNTTTITRVASENPY